MNQVVPITPDKAALAMESALIDGDLSKFTAEQRVLYYKKTCESLGLNYLTKPFAYIRLNGKLVLYALKDCTEQLRQRDIVSIYEMKTQLIEGVFIATAYARNKDNKEDVATGAVAVQGLKGENLANAYMKAETKAKRRVTLSICGLGWSDENEVETIPSAQKVDVDLETGVIVEEVKALPPNRQMYADALIEAKTLDEVKNAYAKAYRDHHGQLDTMKDLTELKDKRKAEIMKFQQATDAVFVDSPIPDTFGAPSQEGVMA